MKHRFGRILFALVLVIVTLTVAVQPIAAQTVVSATLEINVANASHQTIRVHRVTSDWPESVTWGAFGGAYDTAVAASFVADAADTDSVNVTSLVQAWMAGTPNYGILLEQDAGTPFTKYRSREWYNAVYRPKLVITFSNGDVIVQDCVADTSISPLYDALGSENVIYTGYISSSELEKMALLRFKVPDVPGDGEGCTPGFWKQKQHFDSWTPPFDPDDTIFSDFFGVVGPADSFLEALKAKGGGEHALMRHATAAVLNAASPDVDYGYTVEQIIAMVAAAFADQVYEPTKDAFEYENEIGCPLD